MNDTFILNVLKCNFEMEISNHVEFKKNEIVVFFKNGTKAKIIIY